MRLAWQHDSSITGKKEKKTQTLLFDQCMKAEKNTVLCIPSSFSIMSDLYDSDPLQSLTGKTALCRFSLEEKVQPHLSFVS